MITGSARARRDFWQANREILNELDDGRGGASMSAVLIKDSDIITLYTRGIWENVDEGELLDVFSEAGNEPARECDKVEDLLLSRQPQNLDNYTFAAIYIDKIFTDPDRKKRIKKIILVSAATAVLILIICLVIFLWRRDRAQKREDMEQYFSNAETYIEDNNFIRAREECGKALELAEKLNDSELEERYNAYLISLEAVIGADDSCEEGDYTEAKDAYLTAKARVRYADNAGLSYMMQLQWRRLRQQFIILESQ